MYIHPLAVGFVLGVLTTLVVLVVMAMFTGRKKK